MKLIVGLGNPGKQYEKTRHNVGWMVLDRFVSPSEWQKSAKAQAFYCQKEINGQEVKFFKPLTFMNNSGAAVAYAKKKHPRAELIVVHDDKDIELGKIKIQTNRGPAGHKGVQSIIERLGTRNFTRLRVGTAPLDKNIGDTADFVLDKFTKEEQIILKKTIAATAEKITEMI